MFNFLKSKRRKDEDRACKAYQLALNFTSAVEFGELLFGSLPTDEKGQLAYNLMLYGAVDAAFQASQVPDDLFVALATEFFVLRGRTSEYARVLIGVSRDQAASNLAFHAIIEGGRVFQEWMKGNAVAPASLIARVEKYFDDPAFPVTPGHLVVAIMDRRGKAA